MKANRRLLLLSWGVPPLKSGSAVVVGNIARMFPNRDLVLAGEHPGLKDEIPTGEEPVPVVYISRARFVNWKGMRYLQALLWVFQFPLLFIRLWRLVSKTCCSDILVVYPNETYLLAGYLISRWRKLPLYAYFHNTYLENRVGFKRACARWLQGRVFQRAEHLYAISQGLADFYREQYPTLTRCSALQHSLWEPAPAVDEGVPFHEPVRILMVGNISSTCLDAVRRLCVLVGQASNLVLTLHTTTPRWVLEKWNLLGDHVFHESGNISRQELFRRLSESDILYLPLGLTGALPAEEYDTIFPTRTLEYLISGRPILAHVPRNSYLSRFLAYHSCAVVVDIPDLEALRRGLDRLQQDPNLRRSIIRNALTAAEIFRPELVLQELRTRVFGQGRSFALQKDRLWQKLSP